MPGSHTVPGPKVTGVQREMATMRCLETGWPNKGNMTFSQRWNKPITRNMRSQNMSSLVNTNSQYPTIYKKRYKEHHNEYWEIVHSYFKYLKQNFPSKLHKGWMCYAIFLLHVSPALGNHALASTCYYHLAHAFFILIFKTLLRGLNS